MGLLNLFKKAEEPRTLKKEDISVAGVCYYKKNIMNLSKSNPEWKNTYKTIEKNGNIGKKIFRYNFVDKPVKLVPEPRNKHDKNAVQVFIAGELVGYIPSDLALHVKNILAKHEIKYISAFISGGQYKIFLQDGTMLKEERELSINVRIAYV